ncbi:MAG: HNH endonuclease, partial [Acidimicrobiales bacterium]
MTMMMQQEPREVAPSDPAAPGMALCDPAALGDDALEDHICTFASRISAATCAYLLALAEYDKRGSYERWECRSMTQWLSWKCATAPVTAREQLRVAHALVGLAGVKASFASGELSYSQVRAVTRVATAANEEAILELARHMTASQLESVVRSYRGCAKASEEDEANRQRRRRLVWSYDDDGNLVGSFRLPP